MAKELLVPRAAPSRDDTGAEAAPPAKSSDRAAFLVFGAVEAVGFVVYLIIGRGVWFWADEWEFFAGRKLNVHDLLETHGGHLVALPLVVYRTMYTVIGLRAYWPYQVLSIATWLVVAALLRVVMRRSGVGPWIATVAASVFAFFGAAGYDILWGFQISFVGALAFGLAQLLLADHEGQIDRRDWLGLGAGLAAILCSGVAVTVVAVTGLAMLTRRGWRIAVLHAAPLGALYGAWWLTHREGQSPSTDRSLLFRWDRRGLSATFDALGHVSYAGWAIAVMLVVGLVFAVRQRHGLALVRTSAVMPFAMVVGAFVFLTMSGTTRVALGIEQAGASRYLGIVAALLFPAIALAADALVRQSRLLLPVVLVLLLVGVPGNIADARQGLAPQLVFDRTERMMRSIPRMDLARIVPGSVHPDPNGAPKVTVSWLLQAARAGRLPAIGGITPTEVATNTLRLSLAQSDGKAVPPCGPIAGPVERELRQGQALEVGGSVLVQLQDDAGVVSDWVIFGAGFQTGHGTHVLRAVRGPLALRVRPQGSNRAILCG